MLTSEVGWPDYDGILVDTAEHDLSHALLEDVEDAGNVVGGKLSAAAFPTSILVDRDGRIVFSKIVFEEGDEVELDEWISRPPSG